MVPTQKAANTADVNDSMRRNRVLRRRVGSGDASRREVVELSGPRVEADEDRSNGTRVPSEGGCDAMVI